MQTWLLTLTFYLVSPWVEGHLLIVEYEVSGLKSLDVCQRVGVHVTAQLADPNFVFTDFDVGRAVYFTCEAVRDA